METFPQCFHLQETGFSAWECRFLPDVSVFPGFPVLRKGCMVVKVPQRNAGVYEFIRSSIDLAEVVEEWGGADLKPSPEGYRALCPIVEQESRNPAFVIYDMDQRWYCHSCRQGGDVVGFWKELHELPTMWDAAQHIARAYDLQLPDVDPKAREILEERRAKEEQATAEARTLHAILLDPTKGEKARDYFASRGFDEETQERFLLGSTSDGRPTIPFWSAGRIHGNVLRNYEPVTPKYKAPANEDLPLGRRPIFMVEHPRAQEYLLVEGFLDTLAGAALDIPTIGSGGAAPSAEQIKDLRDMGEKGARILIFPDGDERGELAALEAMEKLYPYARLMSAPPTGLRTSPRCLRF